ncbi:MAG: hypothetical protein AB7N71_06385 [Phycisphaerae bacterium]
MTKVELRNGDGRLSPFLLRAAFMLGVLGLGGQSYATFQKVNLYPYYPKRLLVQWSMDAPQATRLAAWQELVRRYDDDQLRAAAVDAMVEMGLEAQKSTNFADRSRLAIDFVEKMFISNRLTSSQQERYFDNALTISEIQIRPQVESGKRFTVSIEYWGNLSAGVFAKLDLDEPNSHLPSPFDGGGGIRMKHKIYEPIPKPNFADYAQSRYGTFPSSSHEFDQREFGLKPVLG